MEVIGGSAPLTYKNKGCDLTSGSEQKKSVLLEIL